VQIHKSGDEVRVFSRRLRELTASLPDVVALVRRDAAAHTAIYDGEVIAVRDGRPLPFQDLMRRFRRTRDITAVAEEIPIELHLFDLLYRDGESLLDRTALERWAELDRARGRLARVPSRRPVTVADGEAFYREALAAGHEGVMAARHG
jgi:DNA ligase-1